MALGVKSRTAGRMRAFPVRRPVGGRTEHSVPGTPRATPIDLPLVVGLAAVGFTAIYFISDLIEVA
jgi:hypothetical protein